MGNILDGSESELFDCVASGLNEAAGVEINFYSNNRAAGVVDPLYGEYITRKIEGPWKIISLMSWPTQDPQSAESGFTVQFDAKCTISRVHLEEKNAPYPSEGDIIEAWRTPYHDFDSMGKGLYFDVIKVNNGGPINDSPIFVQFELYLIRRPQFGAERKINPP